MGTLFSSHYSTSFSPEECPEKIRKKKRNLVIGIPKENQHIEKRLALTPEAVARLVKSGYHVIVESGAGLGINYGDIYYADAGAEISTNIQDIFQANIVLKISQPTLEEITLSKSQTTIFSMLQLTSHYKSTMEAMLEKKINAAAYELFTDNRGRHPFINSISEIDGICAIMVASELLSNNYGGKGILLGGIPGVSPLEIVILGADVAGTAAARAAKGLGATVKIFDDDINNLRDLQNNIGQSLFTSNFHENVLRNALISADVVIGTMSFYTVNHRFCVSEELIKTMKKGAVLIDLSIGQGRGCFETSELDKEMKKSIYEKFGVLHYCTSNISSRVARTTSMAISNLLVPLLLNVENYQYFSQIIKSEPGFRSGFYLYKGHVVNQYISQFFNYPLKNIDLYLGSF